MHLYEKFEQNLSLIRILADLVTFENVMLPVPLMGIDFIYFQFQALTKRA